MKIAFSGVLFLIVITVTAWVALLTFITPAFVLFIVSTLLCSSRTLPTFYRQLTHFGQWVWMGLVVFFIEVVFGMRVQVYGDAATKAVESQLRGERAFWICNHRTRIDWMLLWSLALRTKTLRYLRIVLKGPLRQVPIFGWAMQHFLFIFLHRRWADDERQLETLLPFLRAAEPESSYLLFPEGTDLSENNVTRSHKYATEKSLPLRHYSLYPRTTGWTYIFSRLREELDAVYDITLFYVDHVKDERPSEKSLLSGRLPRTLIVYLQRVDVQDVPGEKEELGQWLESRFETKEDNLHQFYHDQKLPKDAQPILVDTSTRPLVTILVMWVLLTSLWWVVANHLGAITNISIGLVVALSYGVCTHYGSGIDGLLLQYLSHTA